MLGHLRKVTPANLCDCHNAATCGGILMAELSQCSVAVLVHNIIILPAVHYIFFISVFLPVLPDT